MSDPIFMISLVQKLSESPLYHFIDWPNENLPKIAAGVYTVYDAKGKFLYVGMAGAELTETKIQTKQHSGKRSGLFDRLNSHASGYRSGDRFNIYIGDSYVLRQ